MSDAKKAKPKSSQVPTPPGKFWVTRDRAPDGALAACVEVWTVRPEMNRGDGASAWYLGAGELALEHRWCTWSIAEARRVIGNAVPDHELQVIVVAGTVRA